MGKEKEFVQVQGEQCEILRRYGNGGIGYIEGVGTARLGKKKRLSIRDQIVGDLKAMGMTNKEVAKTIKGRDPTVGECVSVGVTAKDPKVMNYSDEQHKQLVGDAKQRLLEAVPRAAENFVNAIEEGDLVPSTKLLQSVGALQPKKSEGLEEVEKFGDWLMEQRRKVDSRAINTDEKVHTKRELIIDAEDINDETEGERVTISEED